MAIVSSSGVGGEPVDGAASSNESPENGSGATAAEATGVGRASNVSPISIAGRSGSDELGESGVGAAIATALKSLAGVASSLRPISIVTSADSPNGSSLEMILVASQPSSIAGGSIGSMTVGVGATTVLGAGVGSPLTGSRSPSAGATASNCSEPINDDSRETDSASS